MTEQSKYEIGQRIRNCRTKNSMTQAQFAESINVSVNFLSEIENGKKGLSYETLYDLCKVHSISANYILFGEETEKVNYSTMIDIANVLDNDDLSTLIDYLSALLKLRNIK